jgi:hypothetical protein
VKLPTYADFLTMALEEYQALIEDVQKDTTDQAARLKWTKAFSERLDKLNRCVQSS